MANRKPLVSFIRLESQQIVVDGKEVVETGSLNPVTFLSTLTDSEIVRFTPVSFIDNGNKVTVYYQILQKEAGS